MTIATMPANEKMLALLSEYNSPESIRLKLLDMRETTGIPIFQAVDLKDSLLQLKYQPMLSTDDFYDPKMIDIIDSNGRPLSLLVTEVNLENFRGQTGQVNAQGVYHYITQPLRDLHILPTLPIDITPDYYGLGGNS